MLKYNLDKIDVNILRELQQDSKISNVELAERVSLSASPCLARVRALKQSGIIKRQVTLLDPELLGLKLNVFINVSLTQQTEAALEMFQNQMNRCVEVMECYLMTGGSDYLLRVMVADIDDLRQFILNRLTTIEHVSNIRSSIALDQVKYDTALPLKSLAGSVGEGV